jgi:hypothetical protein
VGDQGARGGTDGAFGAPGERDASVQLRPRDPDRVQLSAAVAADSGRIATPSPRLASSTRRRGSLASNATRGRKPTGNIAIEMRLFAHAEVQAGLLWWPIERGAEVLHAWRELTPEIPEPRRGKSFVVVEAVHLGSLAEADALLAPLRALEPAGRTTRSSGSRGASRTSDGRMARR